LSLDKADVMIKARNTHCTVTRSFEVEWLPGLRDLNGLKKTPVFFILFTLPEFLDEG
jgi:hypothetical protein